MFPDDADDFAAEGDGGFEVSVGEVEKFDGFKTEDGAGVDLLLLADSAELDGGERSVFGALGTVGTHDVYDFPSEASPFCDGSRASPICVVGMGEDDHCTGVLFLFGWDGFRNLWSWFT